MNFPVTLSWPFSLLYRLCLPVVVAAFLVVTEPSSAFSQDGSGDVGIEAKGRDISEGASEPLSKVDGTASRLKLTGRKLRDKQRQVQAVVLLFMGVVFMGIALLVIILLYGSWIRRLNRRRGTAGSLSEELAKAKSLHKKDKDRSEERDPPSTTGREGESGSLSTSK